MPTVIDSLLIELGLDASKFDAAQKKSVDSLRKFDDQNEKNSKNVQRHNKDAAEGYDKTRIALTGLAAAMTWSAGAKSFFEGQIQTNAALGRQSQLLGVSAKELDAWGSAARATGGTAEGMLGSIQNLEAGLAAFKVGRGSADFLGALAQLGLTPKADQTKIDLLEVSDSLRRISAQQGPQVALNFAQRLGLDQGTFQLLMRGREEVKAFLDEVEKNKLHIEENAAQAKILSDKWEKLSHAAGGVADEIMHNATPALSRFLDVATDATQAFGKWDDAMGSIPSTLASIVTALGGAKLALAGLKGMFGGGSAGAAASGPGLLARIGGWINPVTVGLGLALHSEELNKGEDEYMAKLRASQKAGGSGDFTDLEKKYGLPAGSLYTIEGIESGHGKNVKSPAGALGPFQFMPKTAKQYGLSETDVFDRSKSADAAARMIRDLLGHYGGDMDKAVAAYNWGQGNVDRYGMGSMPAETRGYLDKYHGAQMAQSNAGAGGASGGGQTSVVIRQQTINTQATDATGIAKDMHSALQNNALMNFGMAGNS